MFAVTFKIGGLFSDCKESLFDLLKLDRVGRPRSGFTYLSTLFIAAKIMKIQYYYMLLINSV